MEVCRRRSGFAELTPGRLTSLLPRSAGEEVEDDASELIRVLEQEAVARAAVEHGGRVREPLDHREGVAGVDHDVVRAVADEHRHPQLLQAWPRRTLAAAPAA